jgi:hypothetical protein
VWCSDLLAVKRLFRKSEGCDLEFGCRGDFSDFPRRISFFFYNWSFVKKKVCEKKVRVTAVRNPHQSALYKPTTPTIELCNSETGPTGPPHTTTLPVRWNYTPRYQ